MATNQDDLHDSELPPPAYQLTDAEVDRKIADATQRSLELNEQQHSRPVLPPIDEDGFPIWSDELFEFNRAQREREDEQARNNKARSEYTPALPHRASSSSASSSASPPPPHRSSNSAHRRGATSPSAKKQKQDRLGWLDESAEGVIGQDEAHPPMTATQNAGRPPSSARPSASLQIQVGPRPHDVLAQPQSPVSDVEEETPTRLGRAPTYHPRGQAHPGHARVIRERHRRSMESQGSGGLSRNGSVDLPAWTAVAPSLEGPAYEEVMRTTVPAVPRAPETIHPPPAPAPNSRRQSGTNEWKPVQAKPQAMERVAGARQSTMYNPAPAPVPSQPAPVPPPMSRPSSNFDPGVAYRSTQLPTSTVRADSALSGMADAQRELRESGAHAFYHAAVASTLKKTPAFKAPPPPPRPTGWEDDRMSVRSGNERPGSVYSGGAGPRVTMYGGPPVGGIMSGGSVPPPPGGMGQAWATLGGYQPGLGSQVPGAGGYQPNFGGYQPGIQASAGGNPLNAYQPLKTGEQQFQWAPSGAQPPGGYQPQQIGGYQPQQPAGYQPQHGQQAQMLGAHVLGQNAAHIPGGHVVPPQGGGFVAPPPPPAKKGKLYKRL